jgi:hypothetical protein
VTCAAASDCWAVGASYDASGNNQTLIEQDAGSGWAVVPSPDPSGSRSGEFKSVACASVDDCWAVGDSFVAGGGESTLIAQDAGTGWSIVPSPNPLVGGFNELDGVTCVGATDCWAVGSFNDDSGYPVYPLVEHDTGSGWNVVSNPDSSVAGSLQAVTCVSSADCWAVGSAGTTPEPFVEQYTGSSWTAVSSPTPSSSTDGSFDGVACAGASDCWAVGGAGSMGDHQALIEQYTDSGWTIVSSPAPPGSTSGEFSGVTCADTDDCWTVGLTAAGTSDQALIEQYTEGGWTIVSSPTPPRSAGSVLDGVSCSSVSDCWAVGDNYDTTAGQETLIEQALQPAA